MANLGIDKCNFVFYNCQETVCHRYIFENDKGKKHLFIRCKDHLPRPSSKLYLGKFSELSRDEALAYSIIND